MKKLFVGCRVRILWSSGWPELAGQEGRIVGTSSDLDATNVIEDVCEWLTAPDSWGTPFAPKVGRGGGNVFCPASEQLEPILPEGSAPSEFSTFNELLNNLKEIADVRAPA